MYGTRYILRFDSEKYNHDYKILIKERDYAGEAKNKSLGGSPLLRRDDSDSGISGTSLEMVIQADIDGELTLLYTVDNKLFLVELYKNGSLIWTGYLLPEKYSEPFISAPYDVSVSASDGLGILKNVQYSQTGIRSIFDIVKYCCDQTSLALGFEVSFSLLEKTMFKTESVLHQATLNTLTFNGMTCYEVLEECMTSLDCFITQRANRWLISAHVDMNKGGYIYNNSGAKTGDTIREKNILGSIGDDCYPIGSLTNEIVPASKEATFIYDYNKQSSFLVNSDFRKQLEGWSVGGKAYYGYSVNDMHFVSISEYGSVYQRIDVEKTSLALSFSVNYCSSTNPIYWGGYIPETGAFNITIKLTDGTTTKYLSLEEGWRDAEYSFGRSSTTKKLQMFQHYPFGEGDFEKLEITADGFPFSGKLEIKFQDTTNLANVKNHITNVVVTHVVSGGIDVDVSLVNSASEDCGDVKIAFGDSPFTENADMLFNNVLHVKSGGFTSSWIAGGKEDSFLYTILKCVCSRISFPRRQLTGIIQGRELQTFMLFSDKYNDTLFHVKSAALDLLADEMDVTLEQFMPYVELSGGTTESARATNNSTSEYRSSGENEVRVYQSGSGVPMRIKDLSPSELQPDSVIEVDRNNAPKSGKATLQKLLEFILTNGDFWTKEELKMVEGYLLYLGEKIKAGDSDLWAGHKFPDMLDQPVKTDSDVQFKSVIGNFLRSKDFIPGMLGYKLCEDSELRSLIIRSFLEVPELRYNRVDISIGDKWNAPGGGIIESVDLVNRVVTLKLEEGEIGAVSVDDICMGIYHSLTLADNSTVTSDDGRGNIRKAGFSTVYFRITEILEPGKKFKYVSRGVSDRWTSTIPPMPMMHFVGYGNFSNKERQTSNYSTRTYTRYLRDVSGWEFTAYNVAAQFGDLSNLSIFGIDMAGYSIYLNNIYMSGKIDQSAYLPDRMDFESSNGLTLSRGEETIVTCYLYNAWDDVTVKYDKFTWTRDSGQTSEDAAWNIAHGVSSRTLVIKFSDLNIGRVIFSCEASRPGNKLTGNVII